VYCISTCACLGSLGDISINRSNCYSSIIAQGAKVSAFGVIYLGSLDSRTPNRISYFLLS